MRSRERAEAERMFAGQCGATLLKYLEMLSPEKVQKMRRDMAKRGDKPEESRHWGTDSWRATRNPGGVIRTRTGYVYR